MFELERPVICKRRNKYRSGHHHSAASYSVASQATGHSEKEISRSLHVQSRVFVGSQAQTACHMLTTSSICICSIVRIFTVEKFTDHSSNPTSEAKMKLSGDGADVFRRRFRRCYVLDCH